MNPNTIVQFSLTMDFHIYDVLTMCGLHRGNFSQFTLDSGYRIDNGYVDFEVLKAEEGDWKAVMSYPPLSLKYLKVYFMQKRRLRENYLDPTGIPLDDKTYLLVMSGETNEMADPS